MEPVLGRLVNRFLPHSSGRRFDSSGIAAPFGRLVFALLATAGIRVGAVVGYGIGYKGGRPVFYVVSLPSNGSTRSNRFSTGTTPGPRPWLLSPRYLIKFLPFPPAFFR